MNAPCRPRNVQRAARQRGQAMLLTVLLLGVGVSAVVYALASPVRAQLENDRTTAAALLLVRDALIGWSAARIPSVALPNARPGELPCPDANNDGFEDGNCVAGAIGRVPWKTLGIPEPKDGSGETLWYTYSGSFRIWNTNPNPINSDTAGQLTINDGGGGPAMTNVIAIIFAPGAVVGAQVRDAANQNNVANYLEAENANGDAIYTTGLKSPTFNDRLLPLTSDALFKVVNVRVAKEAVAALESYRDANGYYPFANLYSNGTYSCDTNWTRGRFPATTAACAQAPWGAALPTWWVTNNWSHITHYAMSKTCGQLGLGPSIDGILRAACDVLGNMSVVLAAVNSALALVPLPPLTDDPVTVTGIAPNVKVLVIVTGRGDLFSQGHPCATAGNCMEDAANIDGNGDYAKPSRFPTSNDRLAICAPAGTGTSCPINVQ